MASFTIRSKFLSSLTEEKRRQVIQDILTRQGGVCFICEKPIDLSIHQVDIDHIIPLSTGGKDAIENLAVTHSSCNRMKQDANLEIARLISKFRRIEEETLEEENRLPTLGDVLKKFGGSKYGLRIKLHPDKVEYSLDEVGDVSIYESRIYLDKLSGFKSFFIELPIEYLHHDPKNINPRPLSQNVIKLLKEFYLKRPQLHIGLARIDTKEEMPKVYIFDGQHKATAQILLGARKLLLRVFIDPDIEVLTITNERAGSVLRQVAFNKSVLRQLGSTILAWKVQRYQEDKGLEPDDYSFSEKDLLLHFKGETREIKKYILGHIRYRITSHPDNKLIAAYVEFGGRARDKPISYSTIEKTFYSLFIYDEPLDIRPFENYKRQNEIENIVKLMNIIAEKILIPNYDSKIGAYRLEDRIRKIVEGKSSETIPDGHIMATRIVKEEIMYNWLKYIRGIIRLGLSYFGIGIEDKEVMQQQIDDNIWEKVENFVINLSNLPIWVDREKTYLFATKRTYDYWKTIFETGETPDGIKVLPRRLDIQEMTEKVPTY